MNNHLFILQNIYTNCHFQFIKVRLSLALLIWLLISFQSFSQTNNSTVYRFLDVSPTAKSVALGGYQVGLYDGDYSMVSLNPAYLSYTNSSNYSATFVNYLSDAKLGLVNTRFIIPNIGVLGVGLRYFGYGDFDYLDENGNNLGNFSAYDLALSTTFSTFIAENLSAGLNLDLITSSYQDFNSQGLSGSGGLFYRDSTSHFSAGLVIRNLGFQLTSYSENREPLPLDIALGVTKKPENFPMEMSFTLRRLNDWDNRIIGEITDPSFSEALFRHAILGGEVNLGEHLRGRVGYNHLLHQQTKSGSEFDFAGFSFGLGFKIKTVFVDISRSSYSSSGGYSQISIQTKL